MIQNEPNSTSNPTERSVQTEVQASSRQLALANLQRLKEVADRFGDQVERGTIAPPTSVGRWK